MSYQAAFAQALLNPHMPCPGGLTTCNGSDPATRFAVYRNNVTVSLIDALADTYPVVQALVGEDFFRAMARVFVQAQPPRSRLMAWYGDQFADFVSSFAPASSVPYLADVARLEMARVQAYHAADVPPIDTDTLHLALTQPEQLTLLHLVLHPSVHVLVSPFAIYSLWSAHQGALCISSVDPAVPQGVLVFRNELDADMLELSAATAQFITCLQAGASLLEATGAASTMDPEFDLTHILGLLLRGQLITHITTGAQPHEYSH